MSASSNASRATTGIVLAGGGARGAYEVGVLQYIEEELAAELGRPLRPQILCGTSVGALHACHLAAFADNPRPVSALADRWRSLRVQDVVSFGWWDLARLVREAYGSHHHAPKPLGREGGLVDPHLLTAQIFHGAPWRRIGRNIRSGNLKGLVISATHVATGMTTLFIQTKDLPLPYFEPTYRPIRTLIGPRHALASAAIPLLFPPVMVDGELYVDGSLRLNVPLSPALRMGAQRILVVSLRGPLRMEATRPEPAEPPRAPNALFLLGKAMNALLIDNTEDDLERLKRINCIIESGVRVYGRDFARRICENMRPAPTSPLRYVHALHVRPSADIAALAADYLRSPEFDVDRAGRVGRTLKDLALRDPGGVADAASHLLFDGGFADRLIELGRADARAMRTELLRFWSDEPLSEAEDLEAPVTPRRFGMA